MAFIDDDQAQAINAAPNDVPTFGNPRGAGISSWWGGRGVGGPAGQESGFGGFTPAQPPSLWDKLTDALGKVDLPKAQMPGTTFAPQAGAGTLPIFPPGPTPPGMGAYFNAIQNPPASGGNLMARYAALQQLMRGR
jgi:hypothetical protein